MKLSSLSNKLHFATAESKVEDNGKKLINVSRKATIEPLGSLQVAVMLMRNHNHWVLAGVLLLLSLLLVGGACEPALPLEVENKTNQVLTIYVNDFREFNVAPGEIVKERTVPMIYGKYVVEAKNSQGKVVYSRQFEVKELQEADFKIVISTQTR